MDSIATLFERLKTEWVSEFDTFDGRYRLCNYCLEKNALPFRGKCQACYETERDKEEKRIRRRKHSGFTDFCIRCQMPHYDVYVTSSDNYVAERIPNGYRISVSGPGFCSLCTACVEYYATHPAHVTHDYIVWDRNIRLVRKVAEGHIDKVLLDACGVISELGFE